MEMSIFQTEGIQVSFPHYLSGTLQPSLVGVYDLGPLPWEISVSAAIGPGQRVGLDHLKLGTSQMT